MSTHQSPVPTEPFSESDYQNVDTTFATNLDIFAFLRPLNHFALEGFNEVVEATSGKPNDLQHNNKFIQALKMIERASSVFSEEEENDTAGVRNWQWDGAYRFSLKSLPHDARRGWLLGTGRSRSEDKGVDILLAPPTKKWTERRLAGKHATIFIHPQSFRVMLEARHTTIVSKNGMRIISKGESQVLEHGEVINLGDCQYTFELTEHFKSPIFEKALSDHMKDIQGIQWSFNKLLSPSSISDPHSLSEGKFLHSPAAFAQGTFGTVAAGWRRDNGDAVVIKRFKKPEDGEIKRHVALMLDIGNHDNIMRLLDWESYGQAVPEAYCIYTPLAVANLPEVVRSYRPNASAKWTLLRDYLSGLAYLHHEKLIMHRDLSPNNLCVTSFENPKGLIVDLDSATNDPNSADHMKGTVMFLAPEIIALKDWDRRGRPIDERPPNYGKPVDVWALGLNMWTLQYGMGFSWRYFGPTSKQVVARSHTGFTQWLDDNGNNNPDSFNRSMIIWIKQMTLWHPNERSSAKVVLEKVQSQAFLARDQARIELKPVKVLKRSHED